MPVKPRRDVHTLTDAQLTSIARLFGVLSEPTRLRILRTLQAGPANVGQIVCALNLKQANVSKQLAILHKSGVLSRRKTGNVVVYSIRKALVFQLCKIVCADLIPEGRNT